MWPAGPRQPQVAGTQQVQVTGRAGQVRHQAVNTRYKETLTCGQMKDEGELLFSSPPPQAYRAAGGQGGEGEAQAQAQATQVPQSQTPLVLWK